MSQMPQRAGGTAAHTQPAPRRTAGQAPQRDTLMRAHEPVDHANMATVCCDGQLLLRAALASVQLALASASEALALPQPPRPGPQVV